MNRHETKEQFRREKGLNREATGKIFGKKSLEQKGRSESLRGQMQHEYAEARDGIRNSG